MIDKSRIWTPLPIQEKMLTCEAFEILFGGARGGGKTEAGLAWFLYEKDKPHFTGLVLRRHFIDLKEWLMRARSFYLPLGAVFRDGGKEIHFPSGAVIFTGHLKEENAYEKYQGWEIHKLLIEEASHIPSEELYEKLLASVRSTRKDIKPQVLLTSNPDGAGADWLEKRFRINEIEPFTIFEAESGTRVYIPATVDDNPYWQERDPRYIKYLESLPPRLRDMWRYGRWGNYDLDGAYYAKLIRDAEAQGRIANIPIEPALPTFTSWDLGIHDYMAIWFFQVLGREVRAINYYENNNEPLTHYIAYLKDFAEKYRITYTKHFAPHDIRVRELSTGKTRLEIAKELGINFEVAPNLTVADGIEAVRNLLSNIWIDKERCAYGIKALRQYRKEYDANKQVFKDKPVHDWTSHAADAFRMFAISFRPHHDVPSGRKQFDIYEFATSGVSSWEAM